MAVPIRPSKLHRRQFQELTAECFDRQAAAIGGLSEKVQAQGEFIADLAVARDGARTDITAIDEVIAESNAVLSARTFWQRLRWLVSGK